MFSWGKIRIFGENIHPCIGGRPRKLKRSGVNISSHEIFFTINCRFWKLVKRSTQSKI